MEIKVKLNKREIEEIVAYYFSNNKDAHEPIVNQLKNGEVEVIYEDCSIEDGIL
ncbi:hypothetical protein [Metabacillus arenae]|uniref:Uncharacterized protein n=1 Tax=Metabacillus arenae TaxID=2771434 RepID=A0A926NJP7_9BACI|nr:hypothetical protein [Metabacillus arenae]MBD1379101.1 hypothetical protein [Metabacillus arenae]